ncbi:MAG: FtsX-like permease family protein [Blastocatellia bacterium]|nr:FtsX-like permease family protein [Blastocatellia bacterium]
MIRHLPFILKNSLRNRRRSALTIVSIAASLCLLGLLLAIYHSFYYTEATPDQAHRLITRNRVSLANPLPLSYGAQIRQVPGVEEAMIFQWFGGTYKDARDPANFFGRFAVEPKKFGKVNPDYKLPESEMQAFINERQACIVGSKTASRHNMKLGDRITIDGDIFPVKMELVLRGIYENKIDNETLFFNFEYLNESLGTTQGLRDQVSTFGLRIARPEDANAVSKAVDDMFRNSPAQTKTETEAAFGLSFLAFLGNVKLILLSICSAVTFTILLVTGNTMAMTVRERVREVGVLKTLGFTNGLVVTMLVGEAIVISLIGGGIGLLLASGGCALLRTLPSTFANFSQISLPPPVIGLCLSIAVFIGIVSSLFPAWGASRRSIVDALKYTD